jgi:hypothetical protein
VKCIAAKFQNNIFCSLNADTHYLYIWFKYKDDFYMSMISGQSQRSGHPFVFHGQAGRYFVICLVNVILSVITLGIFIPWAWCAIIVIFARIWKLMVSVLLSRAWYHHFPELAADIHCAAYSEFSARHIRPRLRRAGNVGLCYPAAGHVYKD